MDAPNHRYARRIEGRVRRFIDEHGLLTAGDHLLLAVSGGADSLALLLILARLSPRLGATLTAAYVDHGVRSAAETTADRELIARVTGDLGVPYVVSPIDRGERDRGRSPEDVLRRGRYRALARLAGEAGAAGVATGHTRTDQAETVLLRIVRGTGLHGLGAMAPAAPWPVPAVAATSPRLIRPLLVLGREETSTYCRARGVVHRSDPENENPRYLRTRIRRDVLPALRALNPKVETALVHLAGEASAWRATLATQASDVVLEERADGIALNRQALRALPAGERTAALRAALARLDEGRPAPAGAHLRAVAHLVVLDRAGEVHLPRGLRAWTEGLWLLLGPERATAGPLPIVPVPVPGVVDLPGWRISASLGREGERPAVGDGWTAALDVLAADGLEVGGRRSGDRIDIGIGHKLVQDLLMDRKVPRARRDQLPVFRSARGVVWVAGVRVAEWAKPRGGAPILLLRVEPTDGDADSSSSMARRDGL